MLTNMSDPYLDYDYPVNEKKPVQNINFNNLLRDPSKNNILLSAIPFGQIHNKTDISTSVGHKLQSSATSTKNGNFNGTDISSSITVNHVLDDALNYVIPSSDGLSSSKGLYYDVPKNIPVNPRFERKTSLPNLGIPKFPVSQVVRNESFRPPVLPKKSSLVISKISNYSSGDSYMNMQDSNLATLSKNNTSKPLPQLPSQTIDSSSSIVPNHSEQNSTNNVNNIYDIVKNYQRADIYKEQALDNEDCDYEYDYVCLESKKKLQSDDQKIKLLLTKDLQYKYERMVLNLENLNPSYLDKLGTSKKTDSRYNKFVLQQYRPLLIQATNTFHNWTKFTMETIDCKYSPEVYFNFVKHILLSGQNLLTIIKSLNQHIKHDIQNCEIITFSERFLENLKQIVLKTKKASSDHCAIHDLTTSIECASQLVNNLVKHYRSLL